MVSCRMRMRLPTLLALSVILTQDVYVLADGLVDESGHVNGAHTDLALTPEQKGQLERGQRKIRLTAQQRNLLHHLPGADKVFELSVLPSTTMTCTCELANDAVQVAPWKIEVSNALLGRHLEAEIKENERIWRAEEIKRFKAEHTYRGSKELQLCAKAEQIPFDRPAEAIPIYEEALKINPHLSSAKSKLAEAWNNLGGNKEARGELNEALKCFQNSLQFEKDDFVNGNLTRVRAKLRKLENVKR